MSTTTEVRDLTLRVQEPLTLADIADAARRPGVHGHTIAALITKWAFGAGTAADALMTAPAEDLGGLVRDFTPFCESCRCALPPWVESVQSDVPLDYCVTCAVVDQHVSPSDWREWTAERAADVFGHDR